MSRARSAGSLCIPCAPTARGKAHVFFVELRLMGVFAHYRNTRAGIRSLVSVGTVCVAQAPCGHRESRMRY